LNLARIIGVALLPPDSVREVLAVEGAAFPFNLILENMVKTNRSSSRTRIARSCRSVIQEALESRRLMAAPQVVAPPAFPEPGEPLGPDGHFHFEGWPDAPAQQVKASFNQSVTLASGAMSLLNLTTGQSISELTQTDSEPGPTRSWTVGYADPDVSAGTLPRGNYELLFNANKVTNGSGDALDGDRDGTAGDDYVSGFFFMPGDANHDRVVDAGDYGMIDWFIDVQDAEGFSNGDFNYDGVIDAGDYGVIDTWTGTALPPPPDQANEVAAAAGRGFIDVYWTAPSDLDVDGFNIYRSLDAGDHWTLYQSFRDPEMRSWRDEGAGYEELEDGKKYSYRVRAFSDADGLSYLSNKATTVTNLPGPLKAPKVSLISSTSLTLKWNDNTTNETGFEIEQTGPGGVVTVISVSGGNDGPTASYPVTGLTATTGYTFRVRAKTDAQDSAWSPALDITTLAAGVPIAPSHVTAHSSDWSSAHITWQRNSDNETGFTIEKLDALGNWQPIGTAAAGETSYDVTSGLTGLTDYDFRVTANGQSGAASGGSGEAGAGDDDDDDNLASTLTAVAWGWAFSLDSFESVHSEIEREWGGAAETVPGTGDLIKGTADGAVTLTLRNLPPHAALVVSADVGGQNPTILVDGLPLDGWTPDTSMSNYWVDHSGDTATITFDPGPSPGMEYSTPTVNVRLESPHISVGAGTLILGESVDVDVSASDHGIFGGSAQAWPKPLTLMSEVEGPAVTAQATITTQPTTLSTTKATIDSVQKGQSKVRYSAGAQPTTGEAPTSQPATDRVIKPKILLKKALFAVVGKHGNYVVRVVNEDDPKEPIVGKTISIVNPDTEQFEARFVRLNDPVLRKDARTDDNGIVELSLKGLKRSPAPGTTLKLELLVDNETYPANAQVYVLPDAPQ
jgi:hypothetical protein